MSLITAVLAHLDSVANNLAPGGLYTISLHRPSESPADRTTKDAWELETIDGRVSVEWIEVGRREDIAECRVAVEFECETGEIERLEGKSHERRYPMGAFRALVEASPSFECLAVLGDFDCEINVDHPQAWRRIVVLGRR